MIDLLLKEILKANNEKNLSKLQILISNLMKILVIPKVQIKTGTPMQRIRNNYKGEIFHSEEEVSYRQDYWNIKEFGRANTAYSSIFYASLNSQYIKEIRIVNVLETNKEFRLKNGLSKRQVFTSGEWINTKELTVAIFPFFTPAINNNSEIMSHANKFLEILEDLPYQEQLIQKKIIKFICYFFSLKEIIDNYRYSISAFISEFLFEMFDAIVYPSVRANYKTYNIAINPLVVQKSLFLENAAMFELFLYKKLAFIDNVASADIDKVNRLYWNYEKRNIDADIKKYLQ